MVIIVRCPVGRVRWNYASVSGPTRRPVGRAVRTLVRCPLGCDSSTGVFLCARLWPLYSAMLAVSLCRRPVGCDSFLLVVLQVGPSLLLSLCLSVPLSLCPSVSLPLCPSVALSLCPSVALSLCPSVVLSLCPSVSLSLCPSVSLSLCPSLCLSVSLKSASFVVFPQLLCCWLKRTAQNSKDKTRHCNPCCHCKYIAIVFGGKYNRGPPLVVRPGAGTWMERFAQGRVCQSEGDQRTGPDVVWATLLVDPLTRSPATNGPTLSNDHWTIGTPSLAQAVLDAYRWGNLRPKGWYCPFLKFHIQITDRCGRDLAFSLHQPTGGLNSAPRFPSRRAIRPSQQTPATGQLGSIRNGSRQAGVSAWCERRRTPGEVCWSAVR